MGSPSRLIVPLVATVVLAGCSRSATTTNVDATVSSVSSSSVTSSSVTSSSVTSPVVTSSIETSSAPSGAQASGSAGGVDVTVVAGDSAPLRPGGAPMGFTVTLANSTAADITGVGLVVAMGHCSCVASGAKMMPAGSMSMLDPDTKAWVSVPYVREGTGTDFLSRTVVPPFDLARGATNTYQFRVALDPNPDVTAGVASVNVTVTTPSESGTAATIPVSVQP